MFVPVATAVEPWKRDLEGRVFPTARQPGGIVHDAQAAQGFDKVQFWYGHSGAIDNLRYRRGAGPSGEVLWPVHRRFGLVAGPAFVAGI